MSTGQDRLLLVDQVAERLHLAPKTVRRYLREGRLRGVKTGPGGAHQWRVAESEVERWQREGPPTNG